MLHQEREEKIEREERERELHLGDIFLSVQSVSRAALPSAHGGECRDECGRTPGYQRRTGHYHAGGAGGPLPAEGRTHCPRHPPLCPVQG